MATISAVPFSALPVTDDGYTLLNDNDVVHRSSKKLSELVGDKTSSFLTKEQGDSLYQEKGDYLVDDDITGKLDKSQYAVDSATFLTAHQSLDEYASQEWVNNQGFLKEHQSISANEWNDVYETVVTNSGTWETETDWTDDINAASANALSEAKDWVEEQNYITGVDLTNYYTKSETSGANEISAALDGKEDKVFVAEYGVTTYADIKAAYDAGKQIICKYVENEAQTKYISLSQFVKPANIFIFSDWATNGQSIYVHFTLNYDGNTGYQVISNMYYAQNETSGRGELTNAFNTKQDKLTFAGTSNTITSINNSAIGGGSVSVSNSWKQLSEEHGSSGTLDDENFCVYLGADNTAYNASNIIGHNNKALNSNIIGNNNTIDKNLASDSALSAEQYIKTVYNPITYNDENETVYIRNFVAGLDNSADYAKNAYILGNDNKVICDTSADYLNDDNDGYTFIYGWQNSADRNYDMAIGYKSIASGGENIAIGVPFQTITGYNNYSYFTTGYITPIAKGYKNIVIRGNVTGVANTAINSNLTGDYVNENNLGSVTNNSLINSFVSATTTGTYDGDTFTGLMLNNTIRNSTATLSSVNILENQITHASNIQITGHDFNYNNLYHDKELKLSGLNINDNTITNCEKFNVSSQDICRNTIFNCITASTVTANKLFADNIIGKASFATSCSSIQSVNENIIFNTYIDSTNVSAYRGWGDSNDSQTTLSRNFLFGSYIGNYVYGTFSFSDNSDRYPDGYKIANTCRVFNFGDNTINKAECSFVFGTNNINSAINRTFVFGDSNNIQKTTLTNNAYDYISDLLVFGYKNNLISDNSSITNYPILERNRIFGINNLIKANHHLNDNLIVGNCNSISYNTTKPSKSTIRGNVNFPSTPDSSERAAFATYRNNIFGNGNRVSQCITDSLIVGAGNYVFDTTEHTPSQTADYNSIYTLGVGNIAYDGSNQLNIGYNNETSGHFAEAIGDGIVAKGQQLIIGKCNAIVDNTNRYSIEYDSNTDTIKNVEQSGVLFAIGNGTYDYATKIFDSDYIEYYDKNKNLIPSAKVNNEEYITRSNALIVSANGVVSANDYYNAGGDKLSDLTEIIALLRNKPTTGTHVIKCIDGTLTWVAET